MGPHPHLRSARTLLFVGLGNLTLGAGCGRFFYEELPLASQAIDAGHASNVDAALHLTGDGSSDAASTPVDGRLLDGMLASPTIDGTTDATGVIDAADATDAAHATDATNGAPDAAVACAQSTIWETDFSSDPTLIDENDDGVPDWRMRDGSPFPTAQLSSGAWMVAEADRALDTNPPTNFTTRVLADVRMRDAQGPSTPSNGYSNAVFWINVGYTPVDLGALFVSVARTSMDAQQVWLYARDGTSEHRLLLGPVSAGIGFVHVELAIEPATDSVALSVDGVAQGVTTFPRVALDNSDRYATVIAASSPAQFDLVRIVSCAP